MDQCRGRRTEPARDTGAATDAGCQHGGDHSGRHPGCGPPLSRSRSCARNPRRPTRGTRTVRGDLSVSLLPTGGGSLARPAGLSARFARVRLRRYAASTPNGCDPLWTRQAFALRLWRGEGLARDAVASEPVSTLFSLICREYTGKLTFSGPVWSKLIARNPQNSAIS